MSLIARTPILCALAFAPSMAAQQAATATFQQGCGHPLDPYGTVLSYTGVPRLGATFTVGYQAPTWGVGRMSVFAYLFTGLSDRVLAGLPLPVRAGDVMTGPIGAWHCLILTSSEWLLGTTAGYPAGQIQILVPVEPSLVGLRLYQQWMIEWRINYQGAEDGQLYFSNGGVITLGN
jgi:hypothetical protein